MNDQSRFDDHVRALARDPLVSAMMAADGVAPAALHATMAAAALRMRQPAPPTPDLPAPPMRWMAAFGCGCPA